MKWDFISREGRPAVASHLPSNRRWHFLRDARKLETFNERHSGVLLHTFAYNVLPRAQVRATVCGFSFWKANWSSLPWAGIYDRFNEDLNAFYYFNIKGLLHNLLWRSNAPSSSKILAFARIFIKLKRGSRLGVHLKIKDAAISLALFLSLEGRETVIAAAVIPPAVLLSSYEIAGQTMSLPRWKPTSSWLVDSSVIKKINSCRIAGFINRRALIHTCAFATDLATGRIVPRRETRVRFRRHDRRLYPYFKKPLLWSIRPSRVRPFFPDASVTRALPWESAV